MWDYSPEEQANARYSLMQSARLAQMDGLSMRDWTTSDVTIAHCTKYQLDLNILEHIGCFVWFPVN